jgi:hypothetical protein
MSAIAITQVRVHPGEGPAYIALCRELKQLAAKHGLALRLYTNLLAGPNAGVYSSVAEAADLTQLAAGLQGFWGDPASADLQQRFFGPDGVCALVSLSQANEIPL